MDCVLYSMRERPHYFILEDKKIIPCNDVVKWAKGFQGPRHVDKTYLLGEKNRLHILISTVFLGLNHNYGDGPPLVFETMIFGGKHNQSCWRYSTWEDAEAGHREAVQLSKDTLPLSILIELYHLVKHLFNRIKLK